MNRARWWTVAALGLCWAGLHAAASGADLDAGLEQLKTATLELEVRTLDAEQRLSAQDDGSLSIYLAAFPAGPGLVSASVWIDGQNSGSHSFTADEAAALQQDGLYLLARVGVKSGPHQITARIAAGNRADASRSPPEDFTATLNYDKPAGDAALEVVPDGGRWLAAARVRMVPLRFAATAPSGSAKLFSRLGLPVRSAESAYSPGGADDPMVRNARFLLGMGETLQAAAELRRTLDRSQPDSLAPGFYLELSHALTDYGALGESESLISRAQASGADRDAMDTARARLAERYYQLGDWSRAWSTLGERPRAKAAGLAEWQDLASRILIAQGRLGEAAAVLGEMKNQADFESYVRYYNLGVALVADGEVGQGLTVLDRIGSTQGGDAQMLALSDLANLALGTHFLKHGQGASAIPVLERIHAQGPYSNRAVLNLGWAWLAPPGTVQQQVVLGDERTLGPPPETAVAVYDAHDQNLYQRYQLDAFPRAAPEKSEAKRLRRALALWGELADRESGSETGQEALLATALELRREGARTAAAESYARAIAALQASIDSIDQTGQYVNSARLDSDLLDAPPLPGDDRTLHKLPPLPAADYLGDVLAGQPFQARLGAVRDSRNLVEALGRMEQRSEALGQQYCQDSAAPACPDVDDLRERISMLRPALVAAVEAQRQGLRQLLLDALSTQRTWRTRLLTDARLDQARLYDAVAATR